MTTFLAGVIAVCLFFGFNTSNACALDARDIIADELATALQDAYYGDCQSVDRKHVENALREKRLPSCLARDRFARYSTVSASLLPPVPSLHWNSKTGDYVLSVPSFVEEVAPLVYKLLTLVDPNKPVTIDLRDNGGGILLHLQDFLCLFANTASGELYRTRKKGREWHIVTASMCDPQVRGRFQGHVRAVLVNGNTASAAEIAAAYFRQSGVPLLGTTTYGKNMAQQLVELSPYEYFLFTVEEMAVGPITWEHGLPVTKGLAAAGIQAGLK